MATPKTITGESGGHVAPLTSSLSADSHGPPHTLSVDDRIRVFAWEVL